MSKARDLADLAKNANDRLDTVATSDGALSNRNLIINGAMQVAQRGSSVTGITSSGYRTCDRYVAGVFSLGTWSLTQDTDAPDGFANSYKLDCTVANASPVSGGYVFFEQRLEGQNLQHLKKGTADALPVTLSFWVKSSKTGNFQTNLNDPDNNRVIASTVSIDAANTWEYKTLTFDGDTTGSFDNDNNASLRIEMWLDAGTNWTSGSTPTAWESLVSADRAAGTDLAIGDTVGNTWQITGVQLEVGDTATPFEHRNYGDELAKCQRYYYKSDRIRRATQARTDRMDVSVEFPVTMRAIPSVSETATVSMSVVSSLRDEDGCTIEYVGGVGGSSRNVESLTAEAEL